MKERSIKIGVLAIVFVAALFLFSFLLNQGSEDMTASLDAATLPTISFQTMGQEVNTLVGHKREMQVAAVRDQISVVGEDGKLVANLHHASQKIEQFRYEIYTLDGKTKLKEQQLESLDGTINLEVGSVLRTDREALLKLTLYIEGLPIYYYSRVIKDNEYHTKECIEYAKQLHSDILHKENEEAIKKVMEPNSQGDNTTLQHVTIHSDFEHVTWGKLNPRVIGDVQMDIKEAKKAYTSILFTYQVECEGIYEVREFFKVAYGTERVYLIEYDRTMLEVINTSNITLSGKGIVLGIADENMQYRVNAEGTIVAFVHAKELWSYDKKEDTFSLVFTFANEMKDDIRNRTAKHEIRILSMEEDGNMTFSVYGYMNRGPHEGESGLAIYYFNASKNCVEEQVFIPSTDAALGIAKNLNELAYYNKDKKILYVTAGGNLLKIDTKKNVESILIEGLEKGKYVTSDDGHLLAYQKKEEDKEATWIWNFADNTQREVTSSEGEQIVPLGFVGNDFVYGLSKQENTGYDVAGALVQAMHRLEIIDSNNQIVKTYSPATGYIIKVAIDKNMITLTQGVKEGNAYKEVSEDYITNNTSSANDYVQLKTFWTDSKETQCRFEFSKGIQDKKPKKLKPKMVLQEGSRILEVKEEELQQFYAYGHGVLLGVYNQAGDAIKVADQASGIVVSSEQYYVWEDGNRVAWYRNFNLSGFVAQSGESGLDACRRKVASYEGGTVEEIYLRGCSSKDMCYLLDKGMAIIAMKDNHKAILLVGYDAKTVTYVDPADGGTYTSAFEKIDGMMKGSGNTFIGYVK